jgi:hypothetical protein
LKGKNDAEGDTIDFAFKNGRVDEVLVKGAAKGTYFGEKQKPQGSGQPPGSAPADSAHPAGASGAKTPPASDKAASAATAAGGAKAPADTSGLPRPAIGRPAPTAPAGGRLPGKVIPRNAK